MLLCSLYAMSVAILYSQNPYIVSYIRASLLQGFENGELVDSGIWVKEDGSVYKAFFCPWCEDEMNCIDA